MFCPHCGTQTDQNVNFCFSCGYRFKENLNHSNPTDTIEPKKNGFVFKLFGWIFVLTSLVFIPILFGAGAFIMGYLLKKTGVHNDTHATIIMVMGVACGILGTLLGMAAAGV